MLNKFYAVTLTSVYEVSADGCQPSAVKIALRGESSVTVGDRLHGEGCLLSVGSNLQMYVPERHGFLSPLTGVERRIENVNTFYWRGHSSRIVALFPEREEALRCLEAPELQAADPRWLDSTRAVLETIGDDHPAFYVPQGRLSLLYELEKAS